MHSTAVVAPQSTEQRKLSSSEIRRTTKPIMEKRRRARINNSLNELKNLILEYNGTRSSSKDSAARNAANANKLEKADVLEMAVRHVRMIHQQLTAQRTVADPQIGDKFRAGYLECANEVSRYLTRTEGVDSSARQGLLNHLGRVSPAPSTVSSGSSSPSSSPPSSAPCSPLMRTASPTVISAVAQKFFGNPELQLVPTRLPSGQMALLVPRHGSSEISVNCNTLNVLGSSGIVSPAASERSSSSPLLTTVQPNSPMVKMEVSTDESVWRPW